MIPSYAQIILIVVLIVPGFAAIKIYQKLVPLKEKSAFDLSVSSIVLTLFIHSVYTTFFLYKFNSEVNTIIQDITVNKNLSNISTKWLLIYFITLIIIIFVVGSLLAFFKNSSLFYKSAKKLGFQTSAFDNLWYELLYIYEDADEEPYVIIEYEDMVYAGAIHRSSFKFGSTDNKEITLLNPRIKKIDEEKFSIAEVPLIYLNLEEIKSIKFFNGEVLINTNL
jgi:hypothetical protein